MAPAQTRDKLARIAAKKNGLNADDKATIRVEVVDRVKELQAAADEQHRRDARDKLLGSMKLPKASRQFRAIYAATCADRLEALVSGEDLVTALNAAEVLRALNHSATCGALAKALSSQHQAVRFVAARAVQDLGNRLRPRKERAAVLRALGNAGKNESHKLVLREIYHALHMDAASNSDTIARECADALVETFKGRAGRLAEGSRDESADEPGFEVAAILYKPADAERRAELKRSVRALLQHATERFFSADVGQGAKSVLRDVMVSAESALHAMLKVSKVSPPGKIPFNSSDEKRIRKALQALDAALAKAG